MSRAIFRRGPLTPDSLPSVPQLPEEATDDLLGRGYSRRQLFRIAAVFSSVTRTADELSIMCPAAQVPAGVKHEAGWRLLKFSGPFDFGVVGILASVAAPLAAAGISSLAVATFATDYLLVKADRLDAAEQALTAAGHTIRRP